jgi:alanine dehydrogenase
MSVQVPLLDAAAISAALPAAECIAAMRDVLCALDSGAAVQPVRTVLRMPGGGALYTMPAFTHEPRALVVKLITIFAHNEASSLPTHQGLVVVFDPDTGRPAMLLDAARVTAIRTAAVSAAATDALARADATVLAILGTGVQARSHVETMHLVRPLTRIVIWGRSHERALALAADLRHTVPLEIDVAAAAADAVAQADIICTTTAAREPVLSGEWLRPGAHINAIGSSTPDARELDTAAVARARVFVDSIEAARLEAGDLLIPLRGARHTGEGVTADWTELGAVLNGRLPGRESAAQVTLFKSVGLAVEDAAAAAIIMRNLAGAPR